MLDTKALAAATAAIVREHVDAATAPLLARIAALEAEKAVEPDLAQLISAEVAKIEIPQPPEAIAPDMQQIGEMIERAVSDRVAAVPPAKDGESITLEHMMPVIDEVVKSAVGALEPAKDGLGLAGALIDRHGALVVTLTDGTTRDLGPVVGKDADQKAIVDLIDAKFAALPTPKDGRDGFSLENFDTKWDGDRTLTLIFSDGQSEYSHELRLPIMLDRGVFADGKDYETGDAVTWGGSLWVAQRDTSSKPDGPDSGWRLAVKRGRDGKDKA